MGLREQWAELGTGVKALVGLVLLVGLIPLAVVIAAIVASFVLGFGGGAETAAAPQASWGYDYNVTNESSGELTIIHEGGRLHRSVETHYRGPVGNRRLG